MKREIVRLSSRGLQFFVLPGDVVRGVSSEAVKTILSPGERAPDFDLPALIAGVKKRFHLSEQLGKGPVVLAFYPLNWETPSAEQLTCYQAKRAEFLPRAEVVGISVDSIMNTTVWERDIGPFEFPLCSDFWPHGAVSRSYGVFQESGRLAGASERAVFVIRQSGEIVFSRLYRLDEVPPVSDVLESLQKL